MHALALALVLAAPAPSGTATAVARPATPGAHTALTLALRYEMTCGQPGPGPVAVTLPAALGLPRTIPRQAVLVQGKAAPSVAVAGHVVTVGLPKPPPVTCMSITVGTLTLRFTRAAGLVNPRRPGSYTVRARVRKFAFTAPLAIGTR